MPWRYFNRPSNNMEIKSIDHIVLTSSNISQVVEFYTTVLGMDREVFGDDRIALKFGSRKSIYTNQEKRFHLTLPPLPLGLLMFVLLPIRKYETSCLTLPSTELRLNLGQLPGPVQMAR